MISEMFGHVLRALRLPGRRYEFRCVAPSQIVVDQDVNDPEKGPVVSSPVTNTYRMVEKPRRMDRWLDKVVELSGSQIVYFGILAALFAWAFLGIKFGQAQTYKIVISDAQAIINMIFDAFLMRQQLNAYNNHVTIAACLRSRARSQRRMLQLLLDNGQLVPNEAVEVERLDGETFSSDLPKENWLGRISTAISVILGHIVTVFGFCGCIVIWLAFGPYCHWSNNWQLYINSATSALMVFMLAFIANIRERHNKYMNKCLDEIWNIDTALECRLRAVTGDTIENEPVVIPPPKQTKIQRAIDYYADLVGTLAGIVILSWVIIVWIAVGPAFHFNSNWWLLIGTYAGLVGLNDGFVLRNVSTNLSDYADLQFHQVAADDLEMFNIVGISNSKEGEDQSNPGIAYRLSTSVGAVCAHEWMVVSGVILIIGLVIGASAMRWSLTGQLLCNVPPSIIESFFTMILLTGHNIDEEKRRKHFAAFYNRRHTLISVLERVTTTKTIITTNVVEEDIKDEE
ncbi:uncharacterized protein PV09_08634 [Verruconis gallopava]|uniref:Uncharacterized protein n=1 Tax=Verruconis gallopava TaxID=253628 RepID=A0A0D1YG14_9PEZI|nr:uncharacterized protein PV09_08634 [Verruconis gallopava]KIV99701.1 hypothetical protein PV09_08634 [Verruconis gallopava]